MECFSAMGRNHLVVCDHTTHWRCNRQECAEVLWHSARCRNRPRELVDLAPGVVHVIDRRADDLCHIRGGLDREKSTVRHNTLWSYILDR
eukprot:scaffold662_cov364-Pavlova_lutheri.AAC.27